MSLFQEGSARLNRRQFTRLLTGLVALPVAVKLADELGFLPHTTPEAEASNDRFKDVYHTDSMTVNPHTNEIVSVITVNGKNFISIGKISEGRLGQAVQKMTTIDLDSDPKKLLVNPNPNKNSVRMSESGQRLDISRDFDDRSLFLPIKANKAINFDRDGDFAVVNGEGRMLVVDVNNPSFREVQRSTPLEYNSFSRFTKDQANTLSAYAGSAEGLKSVKIDATRRETITNIHIPGVSGEVANIKNVTLPGGREGMVFSNGRKAFVVDAQNPTQILQSVDISFNAGDAQIKGLAVNKTTGELAVSVWSQSQQKTVIEGYTNGAQTTRMERFLDAKGLDTRELKRETDVEFIYDTKENNRGYLVAMSFQGVFRADGPKFPGQGGELGKVIPLEDPNSLVPVTPTATPLPTNTPVPTPPATATPPVITGPEINTKVVTARKGKVHALSSYNGKTLLITNEGKASDGRFVVLNGNLPENMSKIGVNPINPAEIIITGIKNDYAEHPELMIQRSFDGGRTFQAERAPQLDFYTVNYNPLISADGKAAIFQFLRTGTPSVPNNIRIPSFYYTALGTSALELKKLPDVFSGKDARTDTALKLLRPSSYGYEFFVKRVESINPVLDVLSKVSFNPTTGVTKYDDLASYRMLWSFIEDGEKPGTNEYWMLLRTGDATGDYSKGQLTNILIDPSYDERRPSYQLNTFGTQYDVSSYSMYGSRMDVDANVLYQYIANGSSTVRIARFDANQNKYLPDVAQAGLGEFPQLIASSSLRAIPGENVLGARATVRGRGVNGGDGYGIFLTDPSAGTQSVWREAKIVG